MKLRLFLDEDVHFALAAALRKRGYDGGIRRKRSGRGKLPVGESLRRLLVFSLKEDAASMKCHLRFL
jgi:hypothetical protein